MRWKKEKGTSTEVSESQIVAMVMFNLMTKKKVNWTLPLTKTVVFTYLLTHGKSIKSPFNKVCNVS